MAYRRSIAARSNLFYHHRFSPSISHSHRHHDVSQNSEASPISRNPRVRNYIQHRFLGAGNNFSNYRRFAVPAGCGMVSSRNYSSEADKTEVFKEVVGGLEPPSWLTPVYGFPPEWVAAIDSLPPMVAFQHLIDYVHCFTGFNWWASIAATTIIARSLMLPLDIHRSKSKAKYSLVKPHWDAIEKEFCENKDMTIGEYLVKRKALFKEYGASPLQHLKGLLISVPVCCSIFLAVSSMVAKDPSFKDGALWFTDLANHRDVFLLMSTIAIYMIKLFVQGWYQPNGLNSLISIPGLAYAFSLELFPKAIYFVFTSSTLFTMVYEIAIMNSQVKKLLGIPIVPVELPSTNHKSK